MSANSRLASGTSASSGVPSLSLADRLSALVEAAPLSDYLFSSPLGPFYSGDTAHYLPHFVYFGPHSSQESLRLALIAGEGRHDLLAARALVTFVERLAQHPELGHSLNLSFFPVANVLRHLGGDEERELSNADWSRADEPEIRLLAQDARLRGYEGFVRVVTSADETPSAWVRKIATESTAATDVELFNSEDFNPWSVRFETLGVGGASAGPLTLAADLPFAPFEIELALPAHWTQAQADRAIGSLLKRLVVRYRAFHAYGQHL